MLKIAFIHALKCIVFCISNLDIKRSEMNGLEKDSIALIFQLQSLDKNRFIKKIGILENEILIEINKILKKLFQI